jgi:hypothetical protein
MNYVYAYYMSLYYNDNRADVDNIGKKCVFLFVF